MTSSASVTGISTFASPLSANTSKRVHREVRFGAYVLGSTLGEGEFGKVKLGWRKDGKHPSQVAIKLIKRESIAKFGESETKIHREINSLRMLNHPNIVSLVEVLKSGKYIGIVLEYALGGELFDYILLSKYLKENAAKKLFAQLVSGVDYMHSKGLIHRDLKLENLLLDKHKNIIISDFGFVNSFNTEKLDLMKTSCGSPCYAAPELVLTSAPYGGRKVDIWSLGVILYAMLAGYLPFDDDVENEDGSDIIRLYNYICNTSLTFPEYVSPLARDLLRKIIVPDPNKRISMDEIRNHPWLAPHAGLLSIRQPEWDRIHTEDKGKLAALRIINENKQKRYLMFNEVTSSSSLMMNSKKAPAHGRTFTSNSNIIYSNPTTSSSFANVVATAAPFEPSLAASASSIANSSTSTLGSLVTAVLSANVLPTKRPGHVKSASMSSSYFSASNALKAVVSENESKRRSLTLDIDPAAVLAQNPHVSLPHGIPRSTTYNGSIGTIVESPVAGEFPQTDKPLLDQQALLPETPKVLSELAKLPHSTKKPRPTSYHPGSMSSVIMAGNSSSVTLLETSKLSSPVPIPLLSTSPTKALSLSDSDAADAGLSESPGSSSNVPVRKSNRRKSVVTPINVNGVLTSDLNSHENKRNSVLSYLEDKMDALELTNLHSPTRQLIPKLDTDLPSLVYNTPQIDQLPTFAVPTESPVVNDIVKELEPATPVTALSHRNSSASRDHERNKENRERDIREKEKKRNRFSILSFYGTSAEPVPPSVTTPRRALDVSKNDNVLRPIKDHKVGATDPAINRRSISGSSTTYVNGKEVSAARKVMNFFKRRSVRVG